jgi:hypothetical protein
MAHRCDYCDNRSVAKLESKICAVKGHIPALFMIPMVSSILCVKACFLRFAASTLAASGPTFTISLSVKVTWLFTVDCCLRDLRWAWCLRATMPPRPMIETAIEMTIHIVKEITLRDSQFSRLVPRQTHTNRKLFSSMMELSLLVSNFDRQPMEGGNSTGTFMGAFIDGVDDADLVADQALMPVVLPSRPVRGSTGSCPMYHIPSVVWNIYNAGFWSAPGFTQPWSYVIWNKGLLERSQTEADLENPVTWSCLQSVAHRPGLVLSPRHKARLHRKSNRVLTIILYKNAGIWRVETEKFGCAGGIRLVLEHLHEEIFCF